MVLVYTDGRIDYLPEEITLWELLGDSLRLKMFHGMFHVVNLDGKIIGRLEK